MQGLIYKRSFKEDIPRKLYLVNEVIQPGKGFMCMLLILFITVHEILGN